MGMLSALIGAALLAVAVVADDPQCPSDSPVSCSTDNIQDTCCTEVQGQVVQVQLWDTNPATGPNNSWTIHGLWPDACNGSYSSSCDPSRETYNISCILEEYNQTALLDTMNQYWLNDNGNNEEFWEHEWNKHGTCYSTLTPSCFPNYTQQEEVVAFFQQVVNQFQQLDTYSYLSDAGIVPSSTTTYNSDDILNALESPRGVSANIACESGALYQVSYTFNVQGSVADGNFIPANPVGESNDCPSTGIQYLPKDLDTAPQTSPTSCPS